MKLKTWTTWILLLLLPGSVGWLTVLTQRSIQDQKIEAARRTYQTQAREYLEMYDHWARLSAEEKLENPWGQDPYGGPEIQRKLQANQDQRLLSSLPELLGGTQIPNEAAELLFGSNWQQTVSEYRDRLEMQEIIIIVSSLLLVSGGLLTVGFLGRLTVVLLRSRPKRSQPPKADILPKDNPKTGSETAEEEAPTEESLDVPSVSETLGYFETTRQSNRAASSGSRSQSVEAQLSEVSRASLALLEETQAAVDPALENLMTPEPVAKELTELTEQMSAIRQFAAEQQTHIRKLQDGYDWLIIKRFCLRIIRCIDNLEDRLELFESKNKDTSVLQDIRDELIFALESSGVEPFEPELGREYRGLEKYAEAVKDRKENDTPERSGTIAEIVRPGYQYLISEDDVKIVRCAQVKLYS